MARETAAADPASGSGRASGSDSRSRADDVQVIFDEKGIGRALMRIAHEIVERTDELEHLYLVAIPNGGIPVARRLANNLREIADVDVAVGILDTTLYRDDLSMKGERPMLRRTEMPSAVDDRVVILVDDVVKTGRTIRAAMDALMDFGRPSAVQVAGLVDRGHRELPIKLDYVGKNVPTHADDLIRLRESDEAEGALEVVVLSGARRGDVDA